MTKKILGLLLLVLTRYVLAEPHSFDLHPGFAASNRIIFSTYQTEGGVGQKGILLELDGKPLELPGKCEPEGGNPNVITAFTVAHDGETSLVFVCSWDVNHSGLGIKGTDYRGFAYEVDSSGKMQKNLNVSKALSGYNGVDEDGGESYFFYSSPDFMVRKAQKVFSGANSDGLMLSHRVVLNRLSDLDYEGIKYYLDANHVKALLQSEPVNEFNVSAYNDLGYALGQAGAFTESYSLLKKVERVAPDRLVLKLNIADALWPSNKESAKKYYSLYIAGMKSAGKEKKIPAEAFTRNQQDNAK
jgi:hypothetical protein